MIKYEKPIFEILIVTDIITTSGNEEYEGEIDWGVVSRVKLLTDVF